MRILLLAVLWSPALSFAKSKDVAVIVQTGSDQDGMGFTETVKRAKAAYRAQGYDIVTIKASDKDTPSLAKTFLDTMSSLRGVDRVALEFVGHGNVVESGKPVRDGQPPLPLHRFPERKVNEREFNSQGGNLRPEMAASGFQYYIATDLESPNTFLGTNDIRSGVENFQKLNPQSKIVAHLENCFSGNVVEAMTDLKNVYLVASSPAYDAGAGIKKTGEKETLAFYDLLIKRLQAGESEINAFRLAQQDLINYLSRTNNGDLITAGLPRDSLQEALRLWCAKKEGKSEAQVADCNCHPDESSTSLKQMSRKTTLEMAIAPSRDALKYLKESQQKGICSASQREKWREFEAIARRKLSEYDSAAMRGGNEESEKAMSLIKKCMGKDSRLLDVNVTYSFRELRDLFNSTANCIDRLPLSAKGKRGLALQLLDPMINNSYRALTMGKPYGFVEPQCSILKSKIDLYEADVECAGRFEKEASPEDWTDLVDKFKVGGMPHESSK